MKCSKCGARISRKWLILGLPWSRYTCAGCGSVFAGSILRFAVNSFVLGLLGFLLIRVVKGKTSPVFLIPVAVLALVVLLADLPGQIGEVRDKGEGSDS